MILCIIAIMLNREANDTENINGTIFVSTILYSKS